MLTNGGMETFEGNLPTGWSSSSAALVAQTTAAGEVHTGNLAVRLQNDANLSQETETESKRFDLSFFALGSGNSGSLDVTLDFIDEAEGTLGSTLLTITPGNLPGTAPLFGTYQKRGIVAPAGTATVRLQFSVTAGAGEYVIIDDVSLIGYLAETE